ncbi:MAG: UvrD-helicase domain-containing protein [Anaerolineae bacterium]
MSLTKKQLAVVNLDPGRRIFLTGMAGCGKTTVVEERYRTLLESGEPADSILVLVGDSAHRERFQAIADQSSQPALIDLTITTFYGFARDAVAFFWPMVAQSAGFHNLFRPPLVLTYDMAQTMMWQIIDPMLKDGYFTDLRLRPQQIVSQLLDNMVRAAFNGLSVTEAIEKQRLAWGTDPEHRKQLRDAESAALTFRKRCFEHSLIDTALTIEIFNRHIVNNPSLFGTMVGRYRHLLVDNVEEQTPVGIAFIRQLLASVETAVVAQDEGGGYKRFLSANPELAKGLDSAADVTVRLTKNFYKTKGIYQIAHRVNHFLLGSQPLGDVDKIQNSILGHFNTRYRRQMLSELGPILKDLLKDEGLQPADVAIILPYMDGALRFKLTQSLDQAGIPYQISRRRESPREVPQVRAWLTWLLVANDWQEKRGGELRIGESHLLQVKPGLHDVTEALSLSIEGLDPVRARMLANLLYDPQLGTFRELSVLTDQQVERLGENHLAAIEQLRIWLEAHGNRGSDPLHPDFFLHRLFSELLSRPPFRQTPDMGQAAVCDWLIQMASRFRLAGDRVIEDSGEAVGLALVRGIYSGLVTANPPSGSGNQAQDQESEGVFISTIQTYLLEERPVAVQVWLETSATGWWDMPRQPLSNGFVLDPRWNINQAWTLEDDARIRNEQLSRVMTGLCSRCTHGVFLATSDLDRRGARQDGMLFQALKPVLRT